VFCEESFQITPYTFISDVDRFRNGPVHELYYLRACQINKEIHARSREMTKEPCASLKYDSIGKTMILRRTPQML